MKLMPALAAVEITTAIRIAIIGEPPPLLAPFLLATAGLVSSLLAVAALAMSIRTPVCLPAPEQDVFQPVFTAAGGRRRKPVRAFCRTTARNLNHASTTLFAVLQERALDRTSVV